MVAGGLLIKAWPMQNASTFRVAGGENDAPDSCEADGGSTHRARLECDVQVVIRNALGIFNFANFAND